MRAEFEKEKADILARQGEITPTRAASAAALTRHLARTHAPGRIGCRRLTCAVCCAPSPRLWQRELNRQMSAVAAKAAEEQAALAAQLQEMGPAAAMPVRAELEAAGKQIEALQGALEAERAKLQAASDEAVKAAGALAKAAEDKGALERSFAQQSAAAEAAKAALEKRCELACVLALTRYAAALDSTRRQFALTFPPGHCSMALG